MASSSHEPDRDAEPITDRVHDTSWSANLEKPEHAADRDLVLAQAIDAVEHTAPGNHVNLVTHENHGQPASFLFSALESALGGDHEWECVDQCGCGGYVTRVHVR